MASEKEMARERKIRKEAGGKIESVEGKRRAQREILSTIDFEIKNPS